MARRRFFVSGVREGAAVLAGDEARHLTRVLRVEVGQLFELSDGSRVCLAEVSAARKDLVEFRVLEDVPLAPALVRVTLFMALIKFDHFELVIEKATELGVTEIVPVITARTEVGLEKAVPKRMERWERIAVEASQQSRRDRLPVIRQAMPFARAVAFGNAVPIGQSASPTPVASSSHAPGSAGATTEPRPSGRGHRYWLDEDPGGSPLLQAFPPERRPGDEVALLIGPEGGWTPAEREAAAAREWTRVSLGRQILRAETAAIASLAVVAAGWELGRPLQAT